ncbi:hypothetical protein EYF80_036461 [Liparis tanakae]|uniref:Uncharacterized protein n=1 Tax=Liparis tanakae TaxID=230148 RepID=A0A4Z2GIM5_9TELE|nr:hypothetical protein EYF80_036461 [Liparis tanakae]
MACDVMLPRNMELMELKKVDLPAPTGPTSTARARWTEHQGAVIRPGGLIFEGARRVDTQRHPQRLVSSSSSSGVDAVEEGLLVADVRPALGVVLRGVGAEHKPGGVVGGDDGGALSVAVVVERQCREAVDAGFVEEVESDVTQEREQQPVLTFREAGGHDRHDGGRRWRGGRRLFQKRTGIWN